MYCGRMEDKIVGGEGLENWEVRVLEELLMFI